VNNTNLYPILRCFQVIAAHWSIITFNRECRWTEPVDYGLQNLVSKN